MFRWRFESPMKRQAAPRRQEVPETLLVESQDQIDQFAAEVRTLGRFAFDTEFVMEDRYQSDLCLIQAATESSVVIIDPNLGLDLNPIWRLIHDDEIETIVHAGQEDLALCVQHSNTVPQRVFDVQIAAGLVGIEYPLSLQKLVQSILHIRLHKSKTLTDWRRRPLSAEQIRYAAEDVAYLPAAHKKLVQQLTKRKRITWAHEEFAKFEVMSLYQKEDEDRVRRLKGVGALRGQHLAVARELVVWRDKVAKKYNRPARILLKDHLLVEIARQGLSTRDDIRHLRGINLGDRDVVSLAQVVKETMAKPAEKSNEVEHREIETPGETALISLMTAVLRSYCLEQNIAYSLVATKRSIQELIRHRSQGETPASARAVAGDADAPTSSGKSRGKGNKTQQADVELLTGWRGEAVGVMLDDILAGRRSIRVELHNGDACVRLEAIEEKPRSKPRD